MKIEEIQETLLEYLNTDTYFVSLGLEFKESMFTRPDNVVAVTAEAEAALNDKGLYATVLTPNAGLIERTSGGVSTARFIAQVVFFENIAKNRDSASGYKATPMELVNNTIKALLGKHEVSLLPGEFYKSRWDDGNNAWLYEIHFVVDTLMTGR